ncbi:hypothetical protein DENIS_1445 [Desulfonema ishimotonii]|uniref:Solute-binding protein family 3/N-terminal domain-containing protein n=1 Tax=Desulfonema ishimotonii TaxID=45657 RepID=A0A401FU38_9BACT|nr:hypothetical protein [Desulfonema ishimotonii]GBC60492.1 hypothetical protein DENIS_1445 [Desulfonema ishimotonii]
MKIRTAVATCIVSVLCCYTLSAFGEASAYDAKIPDNFILKVGYFDFPGLTWLDTDGKSKGLVNEITIKTLENADIPYEIGIYPAGRLFEGLSKGSIHFFNGLKTIPAVAESTISSPIQLFPLEMRAYWRGNKPAIQFKEDFIGHSVVLLKGFSYKDWGAWIRDRKNGIDFYEPYTHKSAFTMLRKGRAEYLLSYKYIDDDILKQIQIPDLVVKPLFRWHCYFNICKDLPWAGTLLKKWKPAISSLSKRASCGNTNNSQLFSTKMQPYPAVK